MSGKVFRKGVAEPSSVLMTAEVITYPLGCEEVCMYMQVEELIRRLKELALSFEKMGQEDEVYNVFIPLCLYLVQDGFLHHSSKDVRLLIACIVADILWIFAPEPPYKEHVQIKVIFKFLIEQLKGWKDQKDPAYKRYIHLLDCLASAKSFNLCFILDDAQDIFCSLFELIFKIVSNEHSDTVKSKMLDVLCPLISEGDTVSNELLNVILVNIVDPIKTSRNNVYNLAKELICKCSETLEPYITIVLNHIIMIGRVDTNLFISFRVYELIYELNHICSSILLSVIPQLMYKLKSSEANERFCFVSLLARMFSDKESKLALHHQELWQTFLGRFNDINVSIRFKCVEYSVHFLLNHPELRKDIVEALKIRQHDNDDNIRFEVVKSIVTTAKSDFVVVSEIEDLMDNVRERTLDIKFKIRREALEGLAHIYKKLMTMPDVTAHTKRAVCWMKERILHTYYLITLDDRILVEKLLNTCLVPYQLEPQERMMKLLYLFVTTDENASKAFIKTLKSLKSIRRHVKELLNCIREMQIDPSMQHELNPKITEISKFLPDSLKASEFVFKFSAYLYDSPSLMEIMESIVSPDTDCKTCAENMNLVLKKLGDPVITNLYHNTIKILLERTSSILFDVESVEKLLSLIYEIVKGNDEIIESLGVEKSVTIRKGIYLVNVLSFFFPTHFLDLKTLKLLTKILSCASPEFKSSILLSLTRIGKIKPIGTYQTSLIDILGQQCKNIVVTGTPKQAKDAVRCLFTNINEATRKHMFVQIVNAFRADMIPSNNQYRTSIVVLGHIALLMGEEFESDMKYIISKNIVKELLLNPDRTDEDLNKNSGSWCEKKDLPEITQCMVAGLKAVCRWLLGSKSNNNHTSAIKILKLLTTFIETSGQFIDSEVRFSNAEESWLRLTAGCCMLKICRQKGAGDYFTALQFYTLSELMNDEVIEVRRLFAAKLHLGLSRGFPHRCLPLDFMGFYSLMGYETDKKLKNDVKNDMIKNVNIRRQCSQLLLASGTEKASYQLPHVIPDYMLVFAIPVLSHNPKYTYHKNLTQLSKIKECLWFILEPLILKNDSYSFQFYNILLRRIKIHRDATEPDNDISNRKMYAICDIALGLILERSTSFELKGYPSEPRIPDLYFKRHECLEFSNKRSYLPLDMQTPLPKISRPK